MDRRSFLKTIGIWSSFFATGQKVLAMGKPANITKQRPNIVFILADDLGYGDVKCFNPDGKINTVCIDKLASEGMMFTDAHSGSAVCSPSRYGILTGRYAWRTRLQQGVLRPYDPPLISKDRLTLPAMLQQNGYHTACIGKWHLGFNWPKKDGKIVFDRPLEGGPTAVGFDYYFGTDVPNYPPYCFIENDHVVGEPTAERKEDDLKGPPGPMLQGWQFDEILPTITAKAVDYISKRAADKKPFFLYFSLTSPHEPIAVSEQFKGKTGISTLADFILETDWAVGEVDKAIKRLGLSDNTLFIFTSDNGHAHYTNLQQLQKHGHEPSGIFRGYKMDIWEGGHRIPFIVHWPGKVKAKSRCSQLICLNDIMATCADLLDVRLPENAGEDSFSILPLFKGKFQEAPHRAVVHHSIRGKFAIRDGKWKLIFASGSGGTAKPTDDEAQKQGLPPIQLYNLKDDISEKHNVFDKHPEIVKRLTALMEKYVADGRSTPGKPQKNDVEIDWRKNS